MKVKVMQVGPIGTNCYILEDETTGKAASSLAACRLYPKRSLLPVPVVYPFSS